MHNSTGRLEPAGHLNKEEEPEASEIAGKEVNCVGKNAVSSQIDLG